MGLLSMFILLWRHKTLVVSFCNNHKAYDDLSYKMLNTLFKTKVIFHMPYDSKKLINEDAGKYLLGRGDMFLSMGNKCIRLQGFYVEDDTIKYCSGK